MNNLVLIGAGGHCESVIDSNENKFNIVGIVDNLKIREKVLGINIIGTDKALEELYRSEVQSAFISFVGIAKAKERREIYSKLKKIGFSFPNIIDRSAIISKNSILGQGIFIGKGAIINTNVKIGDFSVINTGAIIEHDCEIREFVHIAPGAVVCGGVKILDNSHIGVNSTILQGITIGKNVLVAAGSVVIRNIENEIRVCGNPGRVMKNE